MTGMSWGDRVPRGNPPDPNRSVCMGTAVWIEKAQFRMNAAAARAQLGDAAFWTERFDLDGVRIDAVPMMPRAASRRIAHELRAQVFPPS